MGGSVVSRPRSRLAEVSGRASWEGIKVVVAGFGVSGYAVADNLLFLGADVLAVDERATGSDGRGEKADLLRTLGAEVRMGPGQTATLPDDVDLVVTSPGWRPTAPLLAQARAREVPVWGDVELAWRLRDPEHAAAWLAVTGTNGKTTTVQMLDAILRSAGLRSAPVGNVGMPIVEAVMDPTPYDVLAVELSSFQLHYTSSISAESAAVLNVAEDHLDWYAGLPGTPFNEYLADKGRIYQRAQTACVYNVADPRTEGLVRAAEVTDGARAIGITLGTPSVGMLGVVDDILVDRAFVAARATSAAELCTIAELASPAPHFVSNALAAAALARAHGVPPVAVRDGLRGVVADGHRIAEIAEIGGIRFVDDSKATNPHAALASLRTYDPVVWIAGGLAKGGRFDELVQAVRSRLRGVVLLGADRTVIAEALARHAPDVPVIDAGGGETRAQEGTDGVDSAAHAAMDVAVAAATGLARGGDTILLAPGCASMDMYTDYADRGNAFAAAVRRLS
ncbi:MAG: UDP-N-acetylmuramoyl-L-alanine--D-glutamate ligase [Nocardioides sp.]